MKGIVIAALVALAFTTGFTCSKNQPAEQTPPPQEQMAAPDAATPPADGTAPAAPAEGTAAPAPAEGTAPAAEGAGH